MEELLDIWETLTAEEKQLVLLFAIEVQNEKESHGNRLSSLSKDKILS